MTCWKGRGSEVDYVPGLPAEVPAASSLDELFASMACCTRCDLALERTQVVPGVGAADARLMLVGEAPGAREDERGRPFIGAAGKLLDQMLERIGLDRDRIFITNVVACRPPGNRNPRVREVRSHEPWLEEQIRLVDPAVICTLGRTALVYFDPGAKVSKERGQVRTITRRDREIQLFPTLHPAAILRRRTEMLPLMESDFDALSVLLAGSG